MAFLFSLLGTVLLATSAYAGELEANAVEHEMITYSGAPHAFTLFGQPSYRADADQKSWKRFTEFLSETL